MPEDGDLQERLLNLPGFTTCTFSHRGPWAHFSATGRRPLYDLAERSHVMEVFNLEPGQHTLHPPFVLNPQPGIYQTWWYALPLSEKL